MIIDIFLASLILTMAVIVFLTIKDTEQRVTFFFGFIISMGFTANLLAAVDTKTHALITDCQETLPRNQKCILQAVPENKVLTEVPE